MKKIKRFLIVTCLLFVCNVFISASVLNSRSGLSITLWTPYFNVDYGTKIEIRTQTTSPQPIVSSSLFFQGADINFSSKYIDGTPRYDFYVSQARGFLEFNVNILGVRYEDMGNYEFRVTDTYESSFKQITVRVRI